jgi:outer membrane protein OmpA-like peptidoglycan-associated protein
VVVGHASGRTQQLSKVEHELANFRISMARANRVADQLIAMGVARGKIFIEAMADEKPRYAETMPTGEAGNRRAEIYFRQ